MSDLYVVGPMQCRLQVDSTTQISLRRYAGNRLMVKVGGAWEAKAIPSGGVALANTGLTAATKYYVYAYDDSGTLTLEASTTGHATDGDTGVEIKSGDATRTLLGMVYMDAGTPGTFVDSATTKRFLANWYNQRDRDMLTAFSANRTTTSTTYVEVNTEIRAQFLAWADEAVWCGITGTAFNASAGHGTLTGIGFDGTTPEVTTGHTPPSSQANHRGCITCTVSKTLTEGVHYATLLGAVSGGTGTWETADAPASAAAKVRLSVSVRI